MRHSYLFAILFAPFVSVCQKTTPRLDNDTVYTSCGYKIYAGAILTFGTPSGSMNHFRFVKIYSSDHGHLSGKRVLVKKINGVTVSGIGNAYVHIIGSILYKDGTTDRINLALNFDEAIKEQEGKPAELIVPDDCKIKNM
ncbi:MAG TPA: hypothetical protein VMT76_09245 [Puia sp.]|nr:hypothetical protein [Puia sp.]